MQRSLEALLVVFYASILASDHAHISEHTHAIRRQFYAFGSLDLVGFFFGWLFWLDFGVVFVWGFFGWLVGGGGGGVVCVIKNLVSS